jgi:hypothetical protein
VELTNEKLKEGLGNKLSMALKKIIFHFPFLILNLSLKKKRSIQFLSMTNLKSQMENDK